MVKKYVVISTNNNPDYFAYAKYQEIAWAKYGWNLCVMITSDMDSKDLELSLPGTVVVRLPKLPELRDATIAQAGRLYAANYLDLDALIMTCDMDLLPLSDYWHPDPENITVFGHDLTDYTYIPMGYVAMTGHKWRELMKLEYRTADEMMRDAREFPISFAEDWGSWWNYDWTLLSARIKNYPTESMRFVKRGRGHSGFAYGRVDRGDSCMLPEGETLIDAHLENNNVYAPVKWDKFIKLFESIYGPL